MKTKRFSTVFSLFALLCLLVGTADAASGDKATGPFSYNPAIAGTGTFSGAGGGYSAGFQICAPGGGVIFPEGGSFADASIRVFGIERVGDANGNPLSLPVEIQLDSALGVKIKNAFNLNPASNRFYPGDCVDVTVTVSNPGAVSAEYGDYTVVMKAQAVGSGIGVGSGSRYTLRLRPATLTDVDPPVVTIISPFNNYTLGPVPVSFKAIDPAVGPTNSAPGTGVASMSATVSSIGNAVTAVKAVNNQSVTLTIAPSLPVDAGVEVTGTGTFTPTGGTGTVGTFNATSRSGIGTYTFTATATDRATPSNTGTASSTFNVNYTVSFTKADGIQPQQPGNAQSQGQFKFTAKRLDGTFMYDQTVVVKLIRVSDDAVMATHNYGTGAILQYVKIDSTVPVYETNFKRGDLSGPPATADYYKARVLFLDVDGNLIQQAESAVVRF